MKRGDPLGFINILSVAKYQKIRKGDSLRHLKFSKKKIRTVPKKNERGTLWSLLFCRLRKKGKKTKGGTLCSKFALVELGLSELISFCKKWYIRDELCGRTKKKLATVIVGLFSLNEKAPTKKLATVIVGLFSLKEKAPTTN